MRKMSGNPAPSYPEKAHGALLRAILWVAAISIALALVLGVGLYLARMPIAAFFAQRYLAELGIPAEVSLSELSRDRVVARLRLGDASDPDFAAETFSASLKFTSLFSMPTVLGAQFEGAQLKLSYDGTTFNFGSLEPLFSTGGGSPAPDVIIKDSTFTAGTPFGRVLFGVDAEVKGGKLVRFDAKLNPATVKTGTFSAALKEGTIKANEVGDTLDITVSLAAANAAMDGLEATDIAVSGELRGLIWTTENALRFHLQRAELALDISELAGNGYSWTKPSLRLRMGTTEGSYENGRIAAIAPVTAEVTAAETVLGGVRMDSVSANLSATPGNFSVQGNRYALSGPVRVRGTIEDATLEDAAAETITVDAGSESATAEISGSEWSLSGAAHMELDGDGLRYVLDRGSFNGSAHAVFDGPARITSSASNVDLTGSVTGQGSLPERAARNFAGSLPLLGSDPPFVEALTAALRSVSLRAPGLGIAHEKGETIIALNSPLVATGAGGARFVLAEVGNSPAMRISPDGVTGAISSNLSGARLPEARIALSSYRVTGDSFSASATLDARLDYRDVHGIRISTAAELRGSPNTLSLLVPRCAEIEIASFTPGGIALAGESQGRLCPPSGKPLFAMRGDTWRLDGNWSIPLASVTLLSTNLSTGTGTIALNGTSAGLVSGEFELSSSDLTDILASTRFNIIGASARGTITPSDIVTRITLTSKQVPFAAIDVEQSLATGDGTAEIDGSMLSFAPGRLQPADISPMLAALGTRVSGTAQFTGKFAWMDGEITSGGRLTASRMGFISPAGEVSGAEANIEFSSLYPLAAGSGQKFTATRINTFVPLENTTATFAFTQQAVRLESASATIGGGQIRVDPMTYVFAPGAVTQGTLHLSGIDVTPFLDAAGLEGKVNADASIGGNVPFTMGPEGLRFANGFIEAEAPGRIAIKREALTGAVGVGAAGTAPPNAVQDFAYQAMENLAFDKLDATVDSIANGRLGVFFHFVGRHDPEVAADTRLPIVDLVQGTAFDKPVPLPKGTPVDLRLDTSINLDELLAVYFGRQAARAPTQSPATMGQE